MSKQFNYIFRLKKYIQIQDNILCPVYIPVTTGCEIKMKIKQL